MIDQAVEEAAAAVISVPYPNLCNIVLETNLNLKKRKKKFYYH